MEEINFTRSAATEQDYTRKDKNDNYEHVQNVVLHN
jgi:hypothetical protein